MAYRQQNWRIKDDDLCYIACSICTSQHEISTLSITKEIYDNFTLEERQDWICPYCMTAYFYPGKKTETRRGTYTTVEPIRRSTSQIKPDSPSISQNADDNINIVSTPQARPVEPRSTNQIKTDNTSTSKEEDIKTTLTKPPQTKPVEQHSTSQTQLADNSSTSQDVDIKIPLVTATKLIEQPSISQRRLDSPYVPVARTTRTRPVRQSSSSQIKTDNTSTSQEVDVNTALVQTTQPNPVEQHSTSQMKVDNSSTNQDADINIPPVRTSRIRPVVQTTDDYVPVVRTTQTRPVRQTATSQIKTDNTSTSQEVDINMSLARTTQTRQISQRSTSQVRLENPSTSQENNMAIRPAQMKISDTETTLLYEIRMLRGDLRDINARISSLSENMNRKFNEFERRIKAKDDETLILRHALAEHQARVDSTVQPIKYFLFTLVLLYLITFLHSRRNEINKMVNI